MKTTDDMLLFSRLVELKSFTAVAEELDISRSLVSKRISRLESDLGVQLINRSTRQLELTEAGRTFWQYCIRLVDTVQEAKNAVNEIQGIPKGNLYINAPVTFGQTILPNAIVEFLLSYPDINISLNLSDQFVDVIEGGFDIVIRIGTLKDSTLRARKIGTTALHVYAHKNYLAKHGTPEIPADLNNHNCLGYKHMEGGSDIWRFTHGADDEEVHIKGNFMAANGVPLSKAVQSGLGLAMLTDFTMNALKDDDVVRVLEPYCKQIIDIYAVYPSTTKLPIKTRFFIDFLHEYMSSNLIMKET